MYFASGFDSVTEPLSMPIHVSTPVGDSLMVDQVHQSCVVIFAERDTLIDLVVLDMINFDVILGMDWIAPYHVVLDYFAKTVTLALAGVTRIS